MTKIITLACMLCIVAGYAQGSERGIERPVQYGDEEDQMYFESQMKANAVPFRKDNQGIVWFDIQYKEKVGQIEREIFDRKAHSNYEVHIGIDKIKNEFMEALDNKGIDYSVRERNGKDWIRWREEDDVSVRRILTMLRENSLQKNGSERN